MLNSPNMMLSFSGPLLSSVVMGDAQEDWHLLLKMLHGWGLFA